MEVLVQELARMLNVTVEKALEVYPIIRTQYIIYNIIESASPIFGFLLFASIVVLIASGLNCLANYEYKNTESPHWQDEKRSYHISKKLIKTLIPTIVVLITLAGILNSLKYGLAPDLMMLKEFIIK